MDTFMPFRFGCALSITAMVVNTVNRTQEIYEALRLRMENIKVMLFDGSFTTTDRAIIEVQPMLRLSRNGERSHQFVIVSTHVI